MDNFTGTSGNDSFAADNSGTNATGIADVLNGGAGVDTLTVYGWAAADGLPTISNIEKIVMNNSAAGSTISFASTSGLTSVTDFASVGASTVTVGAGVAVTLQANADAATVQTVNYDAEATSASLTLNGVKTNTTKDVAVTGAKVTALNIATTGAASTVGNLNVDAKMVTVNITGDKDLTITDAVEEAVEVVNAAAFTGKLSVKTANQATTPDATAAGGTVDLIDITVLGGSGNDTINVASNASDNEISVNGGAGDDKVVIAATGTATLTVATSTNAGDSIVGGEGSDTLSVGGALSADLTGVVSGFEILETTADATQAMATNKLGITQFKAGDTIDLVLTGVAANSTVTLSGTGTGADATSVDATIGTDTAADVINVNLETAGATTSAAIALTNFETLNLGSTKAAADAATVTNTGAITAADITTLNISGAQELTLGSSTLKAAAAVNASAMTGKLTATFASSVKTYTGSAGADVLSVVAGDLKQGNTFAGGAGTDSLTVTATSAQDTGIIAATGFETINLTSNAAAGDAVTADFRNVTDLATLRISAGDATDTFTLNRLSGDTTLKIHTSTGAITTTVNTGTAQKVAFDGNFTVANLIVDSGVTSLSITSDDGNTTANEAGGVFTALTGSSLATITVLGNDKVNLGTLGATMTTVNASASKGAITVTASGTATSIIGSQAVDTITGGGAADTIQGGKGADVLSGGAGADIYVFEATGADNGIDDIVAVAGAAGDKFNFKNFLSGGTVNQNGGAGNAIVAFQTAAAADVNIANQVAFYSDAALNGAATATNVAALIEGAGDAFSLTAGGKTIIVTGDDTGANDKYQIWYVNDALDGVNGTVTATDVVSVGIANAALDLDTFTTANFLFA